jgi:hypothetical protein
MDKYYRLWLTNNWLDLSLEREPHMNRTITFKQEETSGYEPQPVLDTKTDKQTDCLTVSSNVTLILTTLWELFVWLVEGSHI